MKLSVSFCCKLRIQGLAVRKVMYEFTNEGHLNSENKQLEMSSFSKNK